MGDPFSLERKQVGALIVKDSMIIADGYNGTPSGFPNVCEDGEGNTHWYVLHAEANAITKLAKSNNSAQGATLYITLSPCRDLPSSFTKRALSGWSMPMPTRTEADWTF